MALQPPLLLPPFLILFLLLLRLYPILLLLLVSSAGLSLLYHCVINHTTGSGSASNFQLWLERPGLQLQAETIWSLILFKFIICITRKILIFREALRNAVKQITNNLWGYLSQLIIDSISKCLLSPSSRNKLFNLVNISIWCLFLFRYYKIYQEQAALTLRLRISALNQQTATYGLIKER